MPTEDLKNTSFLLKIKFLSHLFLIEYFSHDNF